MEQKQFKDMSDYEQKDFIKKNERNTELELWQEYLKIPMENGSRITGTEYKALKRDEKLTLLRKARAVRTETAMKQLKKYNEEMGQAAKSLLFLTSGGLIATIAYLAFIAFK
jgi:hypothetical protein